jgi:hypothetical protein
VAGTTAETAGRKHGCFLGEWAEKVYIIAPVPGIEEEERLDPLRCFSVTLGTGVIDRPLVLNSKTDAVGDERELSK